MKVALLNGPPRAGKDTLAGLLCLRGWTHMKFAAPLKAVASRMSGLPFFTDETALGHLKDKPHDGLRGKTPRQFLIALSEQFYKPLYGVDIFGQMAVERLKCAPKMSGDEPLVVFSDCGFRDEVLPVVRYVGKSNCLIVRLERQGCDFSSDSRGYLHVDGVESMVCTNKTREDLQELDKDIFSWAVRNQK